MNSVKNPLICLWLVFFLALGLFINTAYGQVFTEVSSAVGVTLYRSDDAKTYVQVIDLSKGAKVRFYTNKKIDDGTGQGLYGGDNPKFDHQYMEDIWGNVFSNEPNAFSLCNGALFKDFYIPVVQTSVMSTI